MQYRKLFFTVFLLTLSLTSVCSAETDDAEKAESVLVLPEMVVTATRLESDVYSLPFTTYSLNSEQKHIQESIRTAPEALKGVPSILVQKTSYGQGSPYLRGFTGFRTLFMIDGIRLNNSVFRDGPNQYWNTVDPLSIRDYELVMGPSSVLYGSDAIGGTVNALTIEPPDYKGKSVWEPRIYYRGATAERSNIGRMQVGSRLNENLGFIGGISLKDFGDLEGGKDVGRQENTGYQEQDYDIRLDYFFNPDSRLTLSHQTVNQDDIWRTHKTIYGITWEGLQHGDDKKHVYDQSRDLTYLKYRSENMKRCIDGVEFTLSRQVQEEDLFRIKKDDKKEQQGFDVTTWGATLQLESNTLKGEWAYGLDYYHDNVSSYSRKYKADGTLDKIEIQGPVADDASYDSLGLYLEGTFHLFNDGLNVIPGVRYTYSKADADKVKDPNTGSQTTIEGDWEAVVWSLRLLSPLTSSRQNVIFAGVSQGFRAPNLSDLTRFDIARSNEIETPVSNLDPEKFIAYEIGIKSRLDKLTWNLTYYYTYIDNMIVRVPTRTIGSDIEVTKKNSGNGYVHGIELSSTYTFNPEWSAWVTASWMEGKVDAYPTSSSQKEREYITRLMPPTATVGLRWQRESGKYWLEMACNMADRADKLSADDKRDTQRIPDGGTPGYVVFNARAGSKIIKNMDLVFAVENIFDKDYRLHGSGVNEPGRNFLMTVRYNF